MKKFSLILALIFFSASFALAQRTLSGVVSDEQGEPLYGASVLVTGTTVGTTTDFDGKYSINVPTSATSLEISYTGFTTQEVPIGVSNVIDITLAEGVQIATVTVNALGVKVKKDNLGTSSSTVGGAEVQNSGETGLIQGLAGKTSGVQITKNSGDPGAGAYIQIRGQSTITGSLQPLIVVDGIPMFNSSLTTSDSPTDGVVEQSRINDINPDDIESIEVLKSAAAAALWGSRAANGVILITTKKGKAGLNKFNVNFNSSLSFDQISITHPLQDTWGQGYDLGWVPNTSLSWGDKIADRPGGADEVDQTGAYYEGAVNGTKYYPITKKNSKETYLDKNFDQVFRTGYFANNSLSVSSGSDKGSFYLSLGNLNQKGIIRNNSDYKRTNIRVNAERFLGKKVKVSVNSSLAKIFSNRIQNGSNLQGLYLGFLRTASDFDNTEYTGTYYDADGVAHNQAHRAYRDYLGSRLDGEGFPRGPIYNNPGWTIGKQKNTTDVNRMTFGGELSYNPYNWLSIVGRAGVDQYDDQRLTYFPKGSAAGQQSTQKDFIKESQFNTDLFARVNKTINSNISTTVLVGFNYNNRRRDWFSSKINSFSLPYGPTTLENSTPENTEVYDDKKEIVTNAGYMTIDFNLYKQLFISLTGRQEAASTYGENVSPTYFYPSGAIAWQFNKILDVSALSFGKLRASYGVVGVQPGAYLTSTVYTSGGVSSGWGPQLTANGYNFGSFVPSNRLGNPDLGPEQKKETEIGLDLRFAKDKLGISYTYYTNRTTGAIFAVDVPLSTGYSDKLANAASIENKGHEIDFTAQILKKKDLDINLFANVTSNRNTVTDLSGVKSIFLAGFTGSSSRAVEGEPLGTLWGGKYARDDNNNLVLDDNGYPTVAAEEGILGDPNPDWRGSLGSGINYKGFNFSFLLETSQGGDMWFGTEGVLRFFGRSTETDVETAFTEQELMDTKNISGYSLRDYYPDLEAGADGNYHVRGQFHDFGAGPVFLDQEYYLGIGGGFGPVGEQFVQDASWTRLREIGLSYTLKSKAFQEKTKLGSVQFGLTGRNLFIWTQAKGIDPETNLTGTSNGRGLDYFTNPGTKSYLFTLKINY